MTRDGATEHLDGPRSQVVRTGRGGRSSSFCSLWGKGERSRSWKVPVVGFAVLGIALWGVRGSGDGTEVATAVRVSYCWTYLGWERLEV